MANNMTIKNVAPCSLISNTEAQFSAESLDTPFLKKLGRRAPFSGRNTHFLTLAILQEHDEKLHTVSKMEI